MRSERQTRGLCLLALASVALVLPSCGSDSPTISDVPRAQIRVSVDPNPIPGIPNSLTGAVSISYRVTITETAGLGGEVNFVSASVFDPETGLQVALNYFDSADLVVFVGSKRVEAGGTLVVPQTIAYALPDLRVAATLTAAVQVKDDRGSLLNASVLVPIQAPQQQ